MLTLHQSFHLNYPKLYEINVKRGIIVTKLGSIPKSRNIINQNELEYRNMFELFKQKRR